MNTGLGSLGCVLRDVKQCCFHMLICDVSLHDLVWCGCRVNHPSRERTILPLRPSRSQPSPTCTMHVRDKGTCILWNVREQETQRVQGLCMVFGTARDGGLCWLGRW